MHIPPNFTPIITNLGYTSMMRQDQSHSPPSAANPKPQSPIASPLPKADDFSTSFFFTTDGLPTVIGKKVAGLVEELNSQIINLSSLKAYLAVGIPDEAALIRQYCWKVVLGYLPLEKSKWRATIDKQARTYEGLVKLFLPEQKFEDHPILLKKQHPRYKQLEEDYLLWEQIEKDTSRTHAEFSFFANQSRQIMIPYFTSARRQKFKLIYGESEEAYQQFLRDKSQQRRSYRYDYMSRILYIYSKLNSKIQYVQGMNEILAPIFYLVNITKPANAIEQASCFFMFNNAICEILELHIKDLDKSKNGIYGKLNEVNQMLMVIDSTVWQRMNALKIDPFYYCFRWVTLLYAQDFALFDTIRIWESIFSAEDRWLYINLFAIAIILNCRELILENEFTVVMEALHNIRDNLNVHEAIRIADELYKSHEQTNFPEQAIKVKKNIAKQKEKDAKKDRERQEKERDEEQKQKEKVEKGKRKTQKLREKEEKVKTEKEEKVKIEKAQSQKIVKSQSEDAALQEQKLKQQPKRIKKHRKKAKVQQGEGKEEGQKLQPKVKREKEAKQEIRQEPKEVTQAEQKKIEKKGFFQKFVDKFLSNS